MSTSRVGELGRRAGAWLARPFGPGPYRSYRVRSLVQAYFALASLVVGYQFARFVRAAEAGELPLPARPPSVEAYLPISGLMGAVDWIRQGALNPIHPAATLLLLTFLGVSLLLRRSFCSWICPVGLLSDVLARFGQRLFGRTLRPPAIIDRILRGARYLLLGFFLYAIFSMSAAALQTFIHSPYHRVADVKMLLFFERLDLVGAIVLLLLAAVSIFVHGAWCRYLCPYGALAGLLARFSPLAIRRRPERCIDCGRCDQACPARLPVSRAQRTASVECTGCLDCLATCPARGALRLGAARGALSPLALALALALIVAGGYAAGRFSGHWDNHLTDAEYVRHVRQLDQPAYRHPGAETMRKEEP